MIKIDLNLQWEVTFEELSFGPNMFPSVLKKKEGWMKANIPCDVHIPLIENAIIKEPLVADNSYSSEWIEEKSWWFKKVFTIEESFLAGDLIELTLESLDSSSDIFLNGYHLGQHKSTFFPFVKNVKDQLVSGENILLIRITTGVEYISDSDITGIKKSISTESDANRGTRGDKRRAFVRKPQYVFGWDWGPRVATCGIMKNVYIESINKLAIRSVYAQTLKVCKTSEVKFEIEIENIHSFSTIDALVKLEIFYDEAMVMELNKEVLLRSGLNYINIVACLQDAKLWWPNGMGEPSLYTIKASAQVGELVVLYPAFKYGIRTVSLNLDSLNSSSRKFAFEINGVTTFCKGGNWIPADSIYARVTYEKYDTLITEAKEANFNMLRIWGGGIYESDTFYKKCDEKGIMLWHDFMFACSMYPDNLDWFKNLVEKEINYQTRRLRNHASLVLWCGNNENHWGFDEWWDRSKFSFLGGSVCYNNIAPEVVHRNCPNVPYWNSSPYGGQHPNGNDVGDRHHWNDCTMNADMEKRITPEGYDKISSKFISEYGYIGPCRKSSIIKYHGDNDIDKNGSIWQLHNNTFEKETVPAGINKHYINPETLTIDQYLLYAGLCQGLMLSYSLEAIRFKEDCSGSLFWMYNDCWGEVGWTIIDYYLKRKISYYYVKRAFAPQKLIIREINLSVRVMGINDTANKLTFTIEYGYMSFDGKNRISEERLVELEPYTRREVFEFKKGSHDFTSGMCYVSPIDNSNILPVVLRQDEFKNLRVTEVLFQISNFINDGNQVKFVISSNAYAHAVHFNLDDSIHLSDEYFDLLPGEKREIIIKGLPARFTSIEIMPDYIRNDSL